MKVTSVTRKMEVHPECPINTWVATVRIVAALNAAEAERNHSSLFGNFTVSMEETPVDFLNNLNYGGVKEITLRNLDLLKSDDLIEILAAVLLKKETKYFVTNISLKYFNEYGNAEDVVINCEHEPEEVDHVCDSHCDHGTPYGFQFKGVADAVRWENALDTTETGPIVTSSELSGLAFTAEHPNIGSIVKAPYIESAWFEWIMKDEKLTYVIELFLHKDTEEVSQDGFKMYGIEYKFKDVEEYLHKLLENELASDFGESYSKNPAYVNEIPSETTNYYISLGDFPKLTARKLYD